MYKRILVPLDGSTVAEAILPQAQMLAECGGAEIVLLSVIPHPNYDYFIPEPALASAAHENQANECRAYLKRIADRLAGSGLQVRTELCDGPVAEAILDYADSTGADLIAMSTHGRSGLGRWLMGSIAERVMHTAKVPVLLVRPSRG
ncbi:MAG: universal stress protein [Chloroflexi bacterium]|nr:universal stress protein [Chloroflexota bacterium]MCL5275663.1 universal stress protein [Chloroflexota bacterium]